MTFRANIKLCRSDKKVFSMYNVSNSDGVQAKETCDEFRLKKGC